mmetsp:Transcript_44695/g.73847  ORF Transcript_44695/g.73847 Transcript_44695/m.73847 type:complete len:87 (-) Transcript_44695:21-281(-)
MKQKIQEKEGNAVGQQHLISRGRQLKDNLTVSDYNIPKKSTSTEVGESLRFQLPQAAPTSAAEAAGVVLRSSLPPKCWLSLSSAIE